MELELFMFTWLCVEQLTLTTNPYIGPGTCFNHTDGARMLRFPYIRRYTNQLGGAKGVGSGQGPSRVRAGFGQKISTWGTR